jgi:3-oxoacyl-[acyl-carrier-protein] synthase II
MIPTATGELAVTGIGCVSGIGIGASAFKRGLFGGQRAYREVSTFDTSAARSHFAGHLDGFDPGAFIASAKLRRMDRIGQLAVASCRLAAEQAQLTDGSAIHRSELGIALGTATAGIHTLVSYLDRLITEGPTGASALDFSNTVGNAATSLCGIELGFLGINVTHSCKEASGFSALAQAATVLHEGRARAIVTGAVDDYEELFFRVYDRFRALATDEGFGEVSRPFDRQRNGFVLGCGGFVFVLETPRSAALRGVKPLAFLAGLGATSSSCGLHDWPTDPSQLIRCMRQALDRAGVTPAEVSVVFASANSSRRLDRVEAEALEAVFGPWGVPVAAIKGALGDCAASAAGSLVAAMLSVESADIPPSIGFRMADPECRVDVSNCARPIKVTGRRPVALINSFASGGTNFSAVIAR